MDRWIKISASFFYLGYLPFAPGAWGSFGGLFLSILLPENTALLVFFLLTGLGLAISRPSQEVFQKSDPQVFVLDEVCGMMLSLVWLPKDPWIWIAAYIIFRILDVWKPGPIGWAERQRTPTSIMNDDLVAGALTNLLLQVTTRFIV